MKHEKGEAAFNSADDVLADRIIDTTGKHGETGGSTSQDTASDYSFDSEIAEEEKSGRRGKAILIASCIGIALLFIGIFFFRCRKCGREK